MFRGIEEEQLVFVAVESPRNIQRPSHCATYGVVTVDGLGEAVLVGEEIVSVKHLVALVPIRAAVKRFSAALGHDIDGRPAIAPVLGLIVVEHDSNFTD